MNMLPPRTIALISPLVTEHTTPVASAGGSGDRESQLKSSADSGGEGVAAAAGDEDGGSADAALEAAVDADADAGSRVDGGEEDEEADCGDGDADGATDTDTHTDAVGDGELGVRDADGDCDADANGKSDGETGDGDRERESELDSVLDVVALWVAVLLVVLDALPASIREAPVASDGGAAAAARRARAAPATVLMRALRICRVPTRRLHGGRICCEAAEAAGGAQMRKTRSARLKVNVAGGTRSRDVPSSASAAARKQDAVMATVDVALETSVVPTSTPWKVTLLLAEEASCPLPRSAFGDPASDSVALAGAALRPQMKSGAGAPVCASTTATTMSGSGVVEIASDGTNAVGGEETRTEKLAVCSSNSDERSGERHSWQASCTVTIAAVGPASLKARPAPTSRAPLLPTAHFGSGIDASSTRADETRTRLHVPLALAASNAASNKPLLSPRR
jgi:hypothetical protein